MFTVAILAGGLATRLRPMTETIPKSLLTVAGQPFILHQLKWLKDQNIYNVVLCIGFLGESIKALLGNGQSLGLSIKYSYDGDVLLGTGGALKQALPYLGENFFVLYGDSYLTCSFKDVQTTFESNSKPALMTVMRNENCWDKSNVIFENGKIIEYNKQLPNSKMEYIDYGLGIVTAELFKNIPFNQPVDLADIYTNLARNDQLAGYEVNTRFYEIGSYQGIRETEDFLLMKDVQ